MSRISVISSDEAGLRPAVTTLALTISLLGALTVVRLVGLYFSQVDLFYDEAQYWAWSRELAFGYFSKPPLLAWIISLSNTFCGSTEACVRSSSPLLYFGLSLVVYSISRDLYDRRTAFWVVLVMALLPGLSFSSRIISTDVPLLFFWALALLAYLKLLRSVEWRWALLLGAALGLGMLAKYAMIYFVLGIGAAALVVPAARRLLRTPELWFALALGFLLLMPNLIWNVQNGFVTFQQTGHNIRGAGFSFSPKGALEFIAAQFGVIGPLIFGAFIGVLVTIRNPDMGRGDLLMVAFALPPLLIVTFLGLFKPVNANWAAPATISLVIVTIAVLLRRGYRLLPIATLVIGAVVQIALLVGDLMPYRLGIAELGPKADFYRRTLGWRTLGEDTDALAHRVGAKTILGEGRYEMASLIYYLRAAPQPVLSWPGLAGPENQFDLSDAIGEKIATPALFVSGCPTEERLLRYFGVERALGPLDISTGPNSSRRYYAFVLDRQSRPIAAIAPCRWRSRLLHH